MFSDAMKMIVIMFCVCGIFKNAIISQIFGERGMDLDDEEQAFIFKVAHFLNLIPCAGH